MLRNTVHSKKVNVPSNLLFHMRDCICEIDTINQKYSTKDISYTC